MADSENKRYPRGQLSLGPGDLVQVTTVTGNFTNNGKLVHTLKRSPSGRVLGTQELTGTFETVIDEDGPERDYFERVRTGEEVNMRLKIPAVTKSIVGFLTSAEFEVPLDDTVKIRVSYAGRFSD